MTALDKVPSNPNFLSRAGFKLQIQRSPDLNFYVQKINIPGISIDPTVYPGPFVKIPKSGEHIDYEALTVTFKVDEDMKNWIAVFGWMIGLGFPDDYNEYAKLEAGDKFLQNSITSNMSLFVLDSSRVAKFEIIFIDAFPISLAGLDFDSTAEDVEYLEANVSFKYTSFTVNRI